MIIDSLDNNNITEEKMNELIASQSLHLELVKQQLESGSLQS